MPEPVEEILDVRETVVDAVPDILAVEVRVEVTVEERVTVAEEERLPRELAEVDLL